MAEQITYKEAGVDIHAAAELVGDIGELRQRTEKNRKLFGAFGLFAAGFDLSGYKEPVIFTGCDGVGTKLELLLEHDLLEIAGKDFGFSQILPEFPGNCQKFLERIPEISAA